MPLLNLIYFLEEEEIHITIIFSSQATMMLKLNCRNWDTMEKNKQLRYQIYQSIYFGDISRVKLLIPYYFEYNLRNDTKKEIYSVETHLFFL